MMLAVLLILLNGGESCANFGSLYRTPTFAQDSPPITDHLQPSIWTMYNAFYGAIIPFPQEDLIIAVQRFDAMIICWAGSLVRQND